MKKTAAVIRKELLLLARDIPGLVILFLLPVLLIFVVTLAQENALKNQVSLTRVLFIDEANDETSVSIAHDLDSSGFFCIIDRRTMPDLDTTLMRQLVSSGEFHFGIHIAANNSGILLLADPGLNETFRRSASGSIRNIIRGTQSRAVIDQVLSTVPGPAREIMRDNIVKTMSAIPPIKLESPTLNRSELKPGVIQNNVPGFILFAMFFIVIPLAGSLITEKHEGSYQRLLSLPVGLTAIIGGKVIVYIFVCLLQFSLMLSLGIWGFPAIFDMNGLETGNQYFAIALATIAASLAAVGFGTLVGAIAGSHNQAALAGSVLVVLLGIISGTFLPVHLMPAAIRFISHLSPMRWGIDNYLELFVRGGSLSGIIPGVAMLLFFFGLAMIASIVIFAKKGTR